MGDFRSGGHTLTRLRTLHTVSPIARENHARVAVLGSSLRRRFSAGVSVSLRPGPQTAPATGGDR